MAVANPGLPEQRHERQGMVQRKWHQHRIVLLPSQKIRASVLEENRIVPLEKPKPVSSSEICIEPDSITITLPQTISPEQLTAVLSALKSCWKSLRPLHRHISSPVMPICEREQPPGYDVLLYGNSLCERDECGGVPDEAVPRQRWDDTAAQVKWIHETVSHYGWRFLICMARGLFGGYTEKTKN